MSNIRLNTKLNLGFIGSGGDFSLQPLKFLIASEHNLAMVGVDGVSKTIISDPRFQIVQQSQNETVESLAQNHQIPIIDFRQNLNELIQHLEEFQLDLLIVACYTKKLPEAILNRPKIACVNLHPSLLPAYRGPVPLFWQFRQGKNEYGISLHRMEPQFDTGPIIAQKALVFEDGLNHQQANTVLAVQGTGLLTDYLTNLINNQVVEQQQTDSLSSYMSYPKNKDFMVSNLCSARRLFNFISATKHWGKAYPCRIGNQTFELTDVISYESAAPSECQSSKPAYQIKNDIISICCQPGMLKARLFNPINGRILA